MAEQFALTLDLGERLEEFRRVGIEAPGPFDDYVKDVQAEIGKIIGDALPDEYEVIPIHVTDLADSIIGKVSSLPAIARGATVLSTCPEIAYPTNGQEIDINRLVSFDGASLGLGPRPGKDLVTAQVRSIRNKAIDNGVVIVEDGVFSGSTVEYVIDKLEQAEIAIRGIAVGLDCSGTFMEKMEARGYDFFVTAQDAPFVDWVPDHDFIPFIPGSGRVVGIELSKAEGAMPLYDHRNSTSYAVPYIAPFGPMGEWASVQPEAENHASAALIGVALRLFLDIEKRNSAKDLRIGDFLETKRNRLRASLPAQIGHPNFTPLDSKVSKYLGELL